MSIWTRISEVLTTLLQQGSSLLSLFEPEHKPRERSVAFSIAVIALGAKMAKADGQVTRDEVAAFREVFQIAREEEANAARVFDLARQDVTGYDLYAQRIAKMFDGDCTVLCDLMEGLFHIAMADGFYHPQENAFLEDVAAIFGLEERKFQAMRARFLGEAPRDPFEVLGLPPTASLAEARKAYRQQVRDNHPDVMMARGVPSEALKLAERRLMDINQAWEELSHLMAEPA